MQRRRRDAWNYLLCIERDLEVLSRYVEFDEQNFECFSVEITRILLTAASEVDVACKQLCRIINSARAPQSIDKYQELIVPAVPQLPRFQVALPRYALERQPWASWEHGEKPEWWQHYIDVKHYRETRYRNGNLKSAIDAVAGLYVILLYVYADEARLGELVPTPLVLRPSEDYFGGMSMGGFELGIAYRLSGPQLKPQPVKND